MDEIAARLLQLESIATQSIDRATRAEAALQHVMGTVTSMQAAAASTPQVLHAPPPPPFALVDTRQLGKPKTFNGSDAAWRGFRFSLMAYAGAVEPRMAALMQSATTAVEGDCSNNKLNADERRISTQLYYMLALSIDQDTAALTIVERASSGEGLLAWWRLVKTFEPDTAGRAAGMLQEVLAFEFDNTDIRHSFETFDMLVRRYEDAVGDPLGDKLKIGLVHRGLKDQDLRQHLLLQTQRLNTYDLVREEIRSITVARRAMSLTPGGPAPMDIGYVGGKKGKDHKGKGKDSVKGKDYGKGKDQGKSKDKGKGKSQNKDVVCFYCQRKGHLKADCRKRLKDEQGKSGANAVEAAAGQPAGQAKASGAGFVGAGSVGEEWVLAVGSEDCDENFVNSLGASEESIMVDSGCARSVCPPSFAVEPAASVGNFKFTTANGKIMKHYGSTIVPFETDDRRMKLRFEVTDVTHPLLSVAAAVDAGMTVVFSPGGSFIANSLDLQPSGADTRLRRRGNGFFMEGRRTSTVAAVAADEPDATEDMDAETKEASLPNLPSSSSAAASSSTAPAKVEPERGPLARRRRAPHEPTAEEAERHALTHVPYRDWCEACVRGKARENPHRRIRNDTDMDEVEMDYLFLTSPQFPEERVTVLVLALAVDGAIAATVGVKGVTPYMLRFAAGTMEVWGLKDIILKTDQEQAIMALSRSLKDERKDKTQLTNAPRYSHASMGVVERANQTLAGQIRSMRLVLQGHLGQRLPATHPLMAWVVRHAAWLITRFVVRPSGRTAYEALRGRAYRSKLVEIGERVFAKKPGDSQNVTKLDSRWEAGIWVGKTDERGAPGQHGRGRGHPHARHSPPPAFGAVEHC